MNDTAPQINSAILSVMEEVGAIYKSERNKSQGFDYRGIDQVYNRLHPLMVKHGIFTTPKIISTERHERPTNAGGVMYVAILQMEYTFHAADGSSVTTSVQGEGMDSGDKASNKAMAVAHKYALMQIFMIPTEELIDPDAESPGHQEPVEMATDKQMVTIQEYADAGHIPESTNTWLEKRKWKLSKRQAQDLIGKLKAAK